MKIKEKKTLFQKPTTKTMLKHIKNVWFVQNTVCAEHSLFHNIFECVLRSQVS